MRADYSSIARYYDDGTGLSDGNLNLWTDLIAKHAPEGDPVRLLDVGCGTGRFAIPIAQRLGYDTTGVDGATEMLEKARAKDTDGRVTWDCMDAASLRFDEASFDMVFLSHLLHHVDDRTAVLTECHRVLRPGGVVFIRYGAWEQIEDDPIHHFFPEALEIDRPRVSSSDQIEQHATAAGFVDVATQDIVQRTYESAEESLAAVRARSISVLTLMTDSAFEAGYKRLKEKVDENPSDPWLLHTALTLTCGTRNA